MPAESHARYYRPMGSVGWLMTREAAGAPSAVEPLKVEVPATTLMTRSAHHARASCLRRITAGWQMKPASSDPR